MCTHGEEHAHQSEPKFQGIEASMRGAATKAPGSQDDKKRMTEGQRNRKLCQRGSEVGSMEGLGGHGVFSRGT